MRCLVAAVLAAGCHANGGSGAGGTTTEASTGSATTAITGSSTASSCQAESDALFEQRIAPLLATDRPKTCNTCHLSGVDLQMFVQETPCQTMACLQARGLVDLASPADSVVLQWIARADPQSPLIDQEVIDEEYQGFLAWIEASAACGLCYTGPAPCGEPTMEVCAKDDPEGDVHEDPGGCAPLTREALFRHDVYAWRDRCYPCHFEDHAFEAPKWIAAGPCEIASLTTMRRVLDGGLVDLADPPASLLLLKPLAEGAGGVMHGGHDKFADVSDPAYIDFLAWIEREAACSP